MQLPWRRAIERTRQFYGQVVSCLTKVTKSVWAGLLLCVIHYSIARVRFPVHKANLDILVNTQFLWSRSTCKYLVQCYLICSSSLAYNLNKGNCQGRAQLPCVSSGVALFPGELASSLPLTRGAGARADTSSGTSGQGDLSPARA